MFIFLTNLRNSALKIAKLRSLFLFLLMIVALISCTEVRKSFWENGNPKSVLTYKNGALEGSCTWYHQNGNIQLVAGYQQNKLHGRSVHYFDNGAVSEVEKYYNNLKDSVFTQYYPNGKVLSRETYCSDTLCGKLVKYYESGNTMMEGSYHRGMMDGSWLFYAVTGEIIGKADFVLGTGIQKTWYPNGKLQQLIHYQNNVKHGKEEFYSFDGKPDRISVWENGTIINDELPK